MRRSCRHPARKAPLALLAVLALAAILGGCALPPYSEDLSLAQLTRSKLGQPVNSIGPVYAKLDDSTRQNQFYFLPERDDPLMAGGFLVATASYGLRVWYLDNYSTNGSLGTSWSIGLENASETANNYLLQPIKSASGFDLSLIRYTPSDGNASSELRVIRATDPYYINEVYLTGLSALLASYGAEPICAGSNMYAMNDTGFDLQYFLGYSPSTGTYFEIESRTDAANGVASLTPINPANFALSPPLPENPSNAFYCHEMNTGLSYLSYWSGSAGRYKSYSWDSGTVPSVLAELGGIQGRIDAVLTNGQLLSFDGEQCAVYGPAGNKLHEFPMGSLRFCYEQWDPADLQFKLYFSLAYWLYGQEEKSDQLYVEVYAIPTTGLSNLD